MNRGRPIRRLILGFFAVAIALNLLLAGIADLSGGPSGPSSSSYATDADGVAAFADLLSDSGRAVARLRTDPASADLSPQATIVVLDPGSGLVLPHVRALRRFVEAGGRLVIGGRRPRSWAKVLLDEPPSWRPGGPPNPEVLVPVAETAGVDHISGAGTGSWSDPGSALTVVGSPDIGAVLVADIGEGRAILLADTAPLHNGQLDLADNAAFALAVAGEPSRPVAFLETIHGYRDDAGLGAIPLRWRWFLAGCALAASVWVFSRGRHLGPPEGTMRVFPPARRDFVASVASSLERTKDLPAAMAPLQASGRRLIAERVSLPRTPTDHDILQGAVRLGLNETEAKALVEATVSETQAVFAGRAFSRLMGSR